MFRKSRSHHRYARKRGGALEVATHTWYRAEDGAVIDLVGMIHMADRGFFERIVRKIAQDVADGAVVHYERTAHPNDERMARLSGREANTLRQLHQRAQAKIDYLCKHSGLTYQSTVIDPVALGWHVNADVSSLDMLRMMGTARSDEAASGADFADMSASANRLVGTVIHWMTRNSSLLMPLRTLAVRSTRAYIETWRDIHAMTVALNHFEADPLVPIVAPWGGAHLPGMGDILALNGFTLSGTHWIPAIAKRSTS